MLGPVQRFANLFLLPRLCEPEAPRHASGRSTRQRVCCRASITQASNDTIWSLNALSGFVSHTAILLHSDQAQSRSQAFVRRLHSEDTVPVADSSPEASLKAMLKTGGGYTSSPGVLASYLSDAVSLPFDQNVPRRVGSMLSEEIAQTVSHFTQNMLLSDSELGAVFQNTELPGLYMDPVLQHYPSKNV